MTIRVSPSATTLVLGQPWQLDVRVTDPDGCAVADALVVTVTLPDDSTAVADVTAVTATTGLYRITYQPVDVGRFVAVVVGAYGAAAFTAWVADIVAGTEMPDLTALDIYLGENAATDDDLAEALDAEASAQRAVCRIPAAYPPDLRSALLRRCARHLAMKRIPLAVLQGDAELGPTIPPGRDPEVRRLEGPYRKLGLG